MKDFWQACQSLGKRTFHKKALFTILMFTAPAWAQNELQELDIVTGDDGKTRLVLTLKDKSIVTDFDKDPDSLLIHLKQTQVVSDLVGSRKLPNIGKLLTKLAITPDQQDVQLSIETRGEFSYDYYQSNNILTLELFSQVGADRHAVKKSSAANISINFQDIPVRSVLQMVAEHNGFNLVVSDSVNGNLTLRLDDVPWQKALDTILKVKNLDKRQRGNILLVAPKSELDDQERQLLEKRQQERELASLRSEVIKINYANAEDLKKMLSGGDGVSILSSRGNIAVDVRTNSLIIKELSDNIDVIKSLIAALDVPVEQVEIEARIVTVDEGTLDEIGVRWGLQNTNGSFTTGGTIEGNVAVIGNTGTNSSDTSPNIDDFLNVNLGAVSPNAGSIAFQVAKLGKDLLLDLELSALQAESKAEIISSPRLLTTNKRPAYIEQGTELPYLEASSSGAASVSFKKSRVEFIGYAADHQ